MLPIFNTGSGIIPLSSNSPLKLNNVLHVPQISDKLLFVQKLASDNDCTISFNANSFYIQDNPTRQVIHQGFTENGIYPIQVASSIKHFTVALHSVKSSVSTWQIRLGHLANKTMYHIFKHLDFPFQSQNCMQCDISKIHRLPFVNFSVIYYFSFTIGSHGCLGPCLVSIFFRIQVLFSTNRWLFPFFMGISFQTKISSIFCIFYL